MLDKIKKFFKRSETIFWSYVSYYSGILLGIFGAIDWSRLADLDWTQAIYSKEMLIMSLGLIINGIITYRLRIRGMDA